MSRPVIGLSTYVEPARWGAWEVPAALLHEWYVDAVREAGGRAVLLPPDSTDADVLERLDGLVLIGGADNDRLEGGEGADLIIGGGGSDRFIYRSAADSAIGQSDTIRKLTSKDRFDLRGFGGDVKFEFIGNDKFSGTVGELRTTRTSLQADLDGDGSADFQVNFTNKFRLDADQILI